MGCHKQRLVKRRHCCISITCNNIQEGIWIMGLRTVDVTRYIMSLRGGGSLLALVEADDGFKYVAKSRGARHGIKTLIAELIGGEIVQVLGFRLPELVFLNLGETFGHSRDDEEVQGLLQGGQGLNLGLHFLSDALPFDPVVTEIDGRLAPQAVWLNVLLTNVDRTMKDTNMLMWHKELWLMDHGASPFFQYSWVNWYKRTMNLLTQIKDRALLPQVGKLGEVDVEFRVLPTSEKIHEIVDLTPDDRVEWRDRNETPQNIRDIYYQLLIERIEHFETFVKGAKHAREAYL